MMPLAAIALEGSTLPADLTGVVTDLFGVCATVVTTVKTEPIMLIGLAAVVGAIGIRWYKKLTGQRSRR